MIERIEELKAQLDLPHISEQKLLEQAQIHVPGSRTVEESRPAASKCTRSWNRESSRVDKYARSALRRDRRAVRRRIRERIGDAVRIRGVAASGLAVVRGRNIHRQTGLERQDAIELPVPQQARGHGVARHNQPVLSER